MTSFFPRHLRLGPIPLLVFAAAAFIAACSNDDGASGDGAPIRVVTTLPLFADFVREVGGDRVDVTSLLPAGADPHTYEPGPKDVARVADADIAFANGLDLDVPGLNVLEANLPGGAPLVLLGEYAKTADVSLPHGGIDDPHYWLDTFYARLYASRIADQLIALDPQGQGVYEQNLATLRSHIGDAETYLQRAITAIPSEHRALVTTHDAFRHMAIPLGLEVIGAVSHAPGQEEGPQQIAELIDAVKERGLPAVFKEPQISEESQTLKRIAAEQGVLVCTLYSDSLDDNVSTYIDMMRFNADELARCLGETNGG